MEFRNMFNAIFGGKKNDIVTQQIQLLNSCDNYFSPWGQNIYDDATVRTCVDTIARNAAKLRPAHIRRVDDKVVKTDSALDSLLSTRPNQYMSTYDFLYKLVTQLYLYNNAFAYIQTDASGNVSAIYPLDYNSLELRELNNELYCRFRFNGGQQTTVPYEDLIHIRRHFNDSDIFGSSNLQPLDGPLNILNSVKQALENAVKNCTKLRGYLKAVGTVRDEDLTAILKNFTSQFTSSTSTTGGIGAIDNRVDFKQITGDIQTADNSQMTYCREDIYRYFGLSDKMITGTFTESDSNAFYESLIEPLSIQLSQEFTAKVFTSREQGFGNEIVFQTNRLEYADLKSKTAMIQVLQQSGILTVNEARSIFGLDPVENGDTLMQKADYSTVDTASAVNKLIGGDENATK